MDTLHRPYFPSRLPRLRRRRRHCSNDDDDGPWVPPKLLVLVPPVNTSVRNPLLSDDRNGRVRDADERARRKRDERRVLRMPGQRGRSGRELR